MGSMRSYMKSRIMRRRVIRNKRASKKKKKSKAKSLNALEVEKIWNSIEQKKMREKLEKEKEIENKQTIEEKSRASEEFSELTDDLANDAQQNDDFRKIPDTAGIEEQKVWVPEIIFTDQERP